MLSEEINCTLHSFGIGSFKLLGNLHYFKLCKLVLHCHNRLFKKSLTDLWCLTDWKHLVTNVFIHYVQIYV